MAEYAPTVIAMYDLGAEQPNRVAEFRLVDDHAQLTILAADGCRPAQAWFDTGVDLPGQARRVFPEDGPAFLRALLQPFSLTYYRLVDESPETTRPPQPAHDRPHDSEHR